MKGSIAIDYTSGPGHAPGVGRYVRELVRALVRLPADGRALELLEYGRAPRPMEGTPLGLGPSAKAAGATFTRRRIALPRRLISMAGRAPGFATRWLGPSRRCALFHRVRPGWPSMDSTPSSMVVMDFPAEGCAADHDLGRACRAARGTITFSRDSSLAVASRYGVAEDRIYQVSVGAEHWARDLGPDRLAAAVAARDSDRPAILVLGAIRESRRPLDVLAAFEELRRKGRRARIRFVGRAGDAAEPFRRAVSASPFSADVEWIDQPDEAKMPSCVASCSALLHFATAEATPVTPLEAARMGLALVTSPLPAFQEALAYRATYVDHFDAKAAAAALDGALDDALEPAFRDAQVDFAEPFTWAKCAESHRAAFELMISSPPPSH